jgi:UPF0755 protein
MSRYEVLYYITKAKAAGDNIMLVPGETTKFFLYELSQNYRYNFKQLYSYYKKVSPLEEGFLIPETYKIPINYNYKQVVDRLVGFAKKRHRKDMMTLHINSFKEWKRILTVASIIEKESGNRKEMPIVASVIYNRLDKGMKLQMDGTLNYGFYSHRTITKKIIREDTSPYNTYRNSGLPPMPVCNPSSYAIEAALFPKETKYLYFMRIKGTNGHKFAESYKQHLINVKANID